MGRERRDWKLQSSRLEKAPCLLLGKKLKSNSITTIRGVLIARCINVEIVHYRRG
jgi:hypothetical protein